MYILTADGGTYEGVKASGADATLRRMQAGDSIRINSHTLLDGSAPRIEIRRLNSRRYEFTYPDSPARHHWGEITRQDARSMILAHMRRENHLNRKTA